MRAPCRGTIDGPNGQSMAAPEIGSCVAEYVRRMAPGGDQPYSVDEVYGFARAAGFSPDQAVTMTAIAMAESGGRSGARNPVGEDSRGLWQINVRAHADWASCSAF